MYSSHWLFHRGVAGTAGKDSLKLCLASLADLKIAQFTSGVSADLMSSTHLNPEMTPCLQTAFENEWFVTWKCGGFYFIFNLLYVFYYTVLYEIVGGCYTVYTSSIAYTLIFVTRFSAPFLSNEHEHEKTVSRNFSFSGSYSRNSQKCVSAYSFTMMTSSWHNPWLRRHHVCVVVDYIDTVLE